MRQRETLDARLGDDVYQLIAWVFTGDMVWVWRIAFGVFLGMGAAIGLWSALWVGFLYWWTGRKF